MPHPYKRGRNVSQSGATDQPAAKKAGGERSPTSTRQFPVTKAGKAYSEALTEWLQDTRLMSEAVYRLSKDYEARGNVHFDSQSWPKRRVTDDLPPFQIKPIPLGQRMQELLTNLWRDRFVFLESLWEEYLQDLVTELRHKDAKLFEPFCEREFMADIVRDVLTDKMATVDEIKSEAAARFAAGLTRLPFEQQWKQLLRLEIGLSDKDKEMHWFGHLDCYFEMRNCIIHRQSRVSPLLHKKTAYYKERDLDTVDVWPPHLDFYRHQFIACLLFLEGKISAKFKISGA